MRGLKPAERVMLVACLCVLGLPLWFAATNAYRFAAGHETKTDGYVRCAWGGPCRGVWQLPDGERGGGEIEGLTFAADKELARDIALYAGHDWAVTDRSDLLLHAAAEATVALLGTGAVLWCRQLARSTPRTRTHPY